MIRFEDIPDNSEFNVMFKRKFLESVEAGSDHFEFVVRGDGRCFDADEQHGIRRESRGGLEVIHVGENAKPCKKFKNGMQVIDIGGER